MGEQACRERKKERERDGKTERGEETGAGSGKGDRQTDGWYTKRTRGGGCPDRTRETEVKKRAGDREGRMGVETQGTEREKRHIKNDSDGENQ